MIVPTVGDAVADSGEKFILTVFNAPAPFSPTQATGTATPEVKVEIFGDAAGIRVEPRTES